MEVARPTSALGDWFDPMSVLVEDAVSFEPPEFDANCGRQTYAVSVRRSFDVYSSHNLTFKRWLRAARRPRR